MDSDDIAVVENVEMGFSGIVSAHQRCDRTIETEHL